MLRKLSAGIKLSFGSPILNVILNYFVRLLVDANTIISDRRTFKSYVALFGFLFFFSFSHFKFKRTVLHEFGDNNLCISNASFLNCCFSAVFHECLQFLFFFLSPFFPLFLGFSFFFAPIVLLLVLMVILYENTPENVCSQTI